MPIAIIRGPLQRINKAFINFFRRVKRGQKPGFPRFRGAHRYRSLGVTQWDAHPIRDGKIWLPKLGKVKAKIHRPIEGKPKCGTIRQTAKGHWEVTIVCTGVPLAPLPPTDRVVGLDMGLTSFFTTDEGHKEKNPRFFKRIENCLRLAQRALSRKKKGSNRRKKAVRRVAVLHEKTARARRDWHHKLVYRLVRDFGGIAVEALNVKDLAESDRAKSVHDVGWGQFLRILKEKAERAVRRLVEVDPAYTSQTCPACDAVKKKHLFERQHKCPCGFEADRDHAAAMVILGRSGLAYANVDGCVERCAQSGMSA